MLRYLIFIIFGILLFLLLNRNDGFNVGIPSYVLLQNSDGSYDINPAGGAGDSSVRVLWTGILDEGQYDEVNQYIETHHHIQDPRPHFDFLGRGGNTEEAEPPEQAAAQGGNTVEATCPEGVPGVLVIPRGLPPFTVTGADFLELQYRIIPISGAVLPHPLEVDTFNTREDAQEAIQAYVEQYPEGNDMLTIQPFSPLHGPSTPPTDETDEAGRRIVAQSNIGKLSTGVCSRVNEIFPNLDDDTRRILTKKIIETILAFIGESRTPIQILGGIRQASLAQLPGGLPHECAAVIYAQCLDISDTNEIPLNILFQLLNILINRLINEGSRPPATMDLIVEVLWWRRQRGSDQLEAAPIDIIIRLTQAINNLPSIFGQGYMITIDANFMDYFLDNWINIDDSESGIPDPSSINTYYQFLWIFIRTGGRSLYTMLPASEQSQVTHFSTRSVHITGGGITVNNFAKIIEMIFKDKEGPDLCDDSDS